MIYGQDAPVAIPVADLYDTGMMQMYVNAVRDQYQQGLKDYENFVAKYGDFTSPIAKDVEYWNDKVMGPTVNLIDALYAQGIDPMRNQEARSMIERSVRNVPYAWVNKAKQRKAAAEEYVKNRAALQRAGRWSPEFESYILGGKSLETWDPEVDGDWTRTSPTEYETLQSFVHPSFKDIKPHMLTEAEVRSKIGTYDPRYDYKGITRADMERSMRSALPGLIGNEKYGFFKDQARKELMLDHADDPNYIPTDAEITERFIQNAITADAQVMTPFDYEANDWAKMEQQKRDQIALDNIRTGNDIRAHKANKAVDHYYTMLEGGADTNGDGEVSKGEAAAWSKAAAAGGGKGNKDKKYYNVFEDARQEGNKFAKYKHQMSNELRIDPINEGVEFTPGKTDQDNSGYSVPAGKGNNLFFEHKSVYSKTKPKRILLDNQAEYTFIPNGTIHARKDRNGKYRYFISGQLRKGNELIQPEGTDYNIVEMEVKEGSYDRNYIYAK